MDTHDELFTPVTGDDGRPDFEIGLGTLCAWADVSDETILKHVNEGVLRRHGRGRYRLREALQARARFLADERRNATKTAAENRLNVARIERLELQNERESGALVREARTEALALIDEFGGMLQSDMLAIPARVTKDLALRQQIETEIRGVFAAASKRAAAENTGGSGGGGVAPPPNRQQRRAARHAGR